MGTSYLNPSEDETWDLSDMGVSEEYSKNSNIVNNKNSRSITERDKRSNSSENSNSDKNEDNGAYSADPTWYQT
jgi:hypothetical protein